MNAIEWFRDDKADWGTVDGQRRYMVPITRRTLLVNEVALTGEVRSISTHTHGDGTQSIDISFVPDNADDTVRAIESMRVDTPVDALAERNEVDR